MSRRTSTILLSIGLVLFALSAAMFYVVVWLGPGSTKDNLADTALVTAFVATGIGCAGLVGRDS